MKVVAARVAATMAPARVGGALVAMVAAKEAGGRAEIREAAGVAVTMAAVAVAAGLPAEEGLVVGRVVTRAVEVKAGVVAAAEDLVDEAARAEEKASRVGMAAPRAAGGGVAGEQEAAVEAG